MGNNINVAINVNKNNNFFNSVVLSNIIQYLSKMSHALSPYDKTTWQNPNNYDPGLLKSHP